MKKLIYKVFGSFMLLATIVSCQDFEELNKSPNDPSYMQSDMLMAGTTKRIMSYVYDAWFSGRQCLVYSQYWAQRNYTEEDRYQIRESVNNNYFNYFYQGIAGLDKVIELNTNPATAADMAALGANQNQIAAARTLKVWLYIVITDTWGNVPYSEASKLGEALYYPKYDDQKSVYEALLAETKEAAAQFDVNQPAFIGGDRIYDGDAAKWKKFANSLRLRLAIHLSKVDPNWKTYISEAVASGVFTGSDDNAAYAWTSASPYQNEFWRAFFTGDQRNDFTITRPFVDILKGQKDTLNNKTHPWEGVVDPRLAIYTNARNGQYIGIPFGIANNQVTAAMRATAPTWNIDPPLPIRDNYRVPLMTYSEVQFILSEANGYSVAEYKEGVRASIEAWAAEDGTSVPPAAIDAYVEAVSKTVNAETVALQKYIDLYMNGTEAWTEYRRTGYPTQILQPNEISCISATGDELKFVPLSDTKGEIIARVKYPTNESTLNGPSFTEALTKLKDGTNNYYSKMYWDVRSTANPHPTNK